MRFKTDENLPEDVVALLRAAGHDAESVVTERLQGAEDPVVMATCRREGRAVITFDLDLSDIRAFPPADEAGIVVLRLSDQTVPAILDVMRRLLPAFETEQLNGKLWVVTDQNVRIR
jgi:predicted nuclease of predicted toxin-antitoxin system